MMRLIQVGAGGFGHGWVRVVKESGLAEPVAYVDISPQALACIRSDFGAREAQCFTSLAQALDAVEADAALIVTPPDTHLSVAREALERGLHVLIEKPLADSRANAQALVERADQCGRTLMVSQNYRFAPEPRTLARLVREGAVGRVGYAHVDFHLAVDFGDSFRTRMQYPLLVDMAIHHFDLLRFILGADARSVFAHSLRPPWSWFDHEPTLMATIEMDRGLAAHYFGCWVATGEPTAWPADWRIQGEKGRLCWNAQGLFLDIPEQGRKPVKADPMPVVGLAYSLKEFVDSVAEGREPETSGRDNLKSIGIVFAALEAIAKGVPVSVE